MQIRRTLRIGVDVGGTNTDCVLLDLTKDAAAYGDVLASSKQPTTRNISNGIRNAMRAVITEAQVDLDEIEAVAVGTTHFFNALIERNDEFLDRVAVIRLCGKFTRGTPPFASFPRELRAIVEGPSFFVDGGLQIDGSTIASVKEGEIIQACKGIEAEGIHSVVIAGVFSPLDADHRQEEQVAEIISHHFPSIQTVLSKQVSNIGLLERENASILNASLLNYAHTVVQEFQEASAALKLTCPVMVTSNDGTLLSCYQASVLPIRTFSSGPTNSMRGAAFCASRLSGRQSKETALVVDIGGTTTEVGILLPSGFPRQAGAHTELCGVRLKFSMPQVASIGLGGGSLVQWDAERDRATVGPASVGYRIATEALVFGGFTVTTTDVAVAAGSGNIGTQPQKARTLDANLVKAAQSRIKIMLEETLDAMKTSPEPIPAYLVGGGAFLAPDALQGISEVIKLPHAGVANAIGAAIAQVSGTVDAVKDVSNTTIAEALAEAEAQAVQAAIEAGADPKTVTIIDKESLPIAYTPGKCRFYVKAAGEWSGKVKAAPSSSISKKQVNGTSKHDEPLRKRLRNSTIVIDVAITASYIQNYRPRVENRVWKLSEVDLEWIADGCYILGCGGGGSPTHTFLQCRELLRQGHEIKVVDLKDLSAESLVGWGGGLGTPEVASERMLGEEYNEALTVLKDYLGIDGYAALAALEIGGSNGMINMVSGSSKYFNTPILDADFMGRAYPTGHQVTPNVFDETKTAKNLLPIAMCSGDGNVMLLTKAKSDLHVDPVLRSACMEMGSLTGAAKRPLTVEECRRFAVKNTVSLAWRIGRAVDFARKQHAIGRVGQVIIDAVGGAETAKLLFAGKIVEVSRRTYKGHLIGHITIEPIAQDDEADSTAPIFPGQMRIPFKNENLICEHIDSDGQALLQIVATVPDLISVIDASNGSALGTPDYKYGLRVLVLGITAAPEWTQSARGLSLGGPESFGYKDIHYTSLGTYVAPKSVIEEFA